MMDNVNKGERCARVMIKQQFSPVNKLSPVKSSHGKNLTGHARHIKDLAADLHTGIQQWNILHLQGTALLKEITQEKQNESYSQNLQELCDKLEVVCDSLDDIVNNLGQITHQIKITGSLGRSADKLFTTWPGVKFGEAAESIHGAYCCEAKIKRKILEDVAHYSIEAWKMLCLSTWVYQPSLPEHLTVLLESILVETGHR